MYVKNLVYLELHKQSIWLIISHIFFSILIYSKQKLLLLEKYYTHIIILIPLFCTINQGKGLVEYVNAKYAVAVSKGIAVKLTNFPRITHNLFKLNFRTLRK